MRTVKTYIPQVIARHPVLVSAFAGGLTFVGIATLVMGNAFGFSNITAQSLVPPFFIGTTIGTIISYLVVQNREILKKRHQSELDAALSMKIAVSEKTQAEKDARVSQAQLATIFSIAPEALMTLGEDMKIQLFNKGAEQIFGYSADEVLGRSIKMLMPKRFYETYRDAFVLSEFPQNKRSKIAQRVEGIGLHKDGTEFPGLSSVSELQVEDSKIYILMFQDMTVDKELEQQIRRSQKMDAIGQLTAGVAHDFNNILGIAMGHLELLRERLSGDEKSLLLLDPSLISIRRGAEITKKLLGVSRNDVQEVQRCSVNDVVQNLETLLVKSLTVSIQVDFDLGKELWDVTLNPGELEDALLNLSLNARDAMPHGGKLTIRTENIKLENETGRRSVENKVGEFVVISVADTGYGMTKKVKEKILEPFYTTKEMGKGTGLGLSLVYGFTQRLGGYLEIESEPNKGACFKLFLPRAVDDKKPA